MSSIQFNPGTSPVDSLALVNVDNETITGDGANVPLSAAAQPPPHNAALTLSLFANVDVVAGNPLSVGIGGDWVLADPSSTIALASIWGVAAASGAEGNGVLAVTHGPLTLTIAEWDAVITPPTTGGLVTGRVYYLLEAGTIGDTPDVTSGNFSVQVGVALSVTTMLVAPGPVPVANT